MRLVVPGLILAGWLIPTDALGVVLYSSSQRNTFPPGSLLNHGPAGDPHGPGDPRRLLNSGWQWQGEFGEFLGTPIASQYFITAEHFGTPSGHLRLNSVNYPIDTTFNGTGFADDPASDLRIYKITGTFPTFAPLYNEATGSEVNRPLVVFGRGASRGAEVRVNGVLKGWQWGTFDSVQAWGENVVTAIFNAGQFGQVMGFAFDADGVPNEAALSAGDSGGGVFIQSGGQWKLAGINFSVDGPFRFTSDGAAFNATIFDMGGLWVGNSPQFVPDQATDIPGRSYSTLISSNLGWINSVIGGGLTPEPSVGLIVVGLAPLLCRRRVPTSSAPDASELPRTAD